MDSISKGGWKKRLTSEENTDKPQKCKAYYFHIACTEDMENILQSPS